MDNWAFCLFVCFCFCFSRICLTLNYYTFYFNFIRFICYIDGMFESEFPFKDNKVLSYLIILSDLILL